MMPSKFSFPLVVAMGLTILGCSHSDEQAVAGSVQTPALHLEDSAAGTSAPEEDGHRLSLEPKTLTTVAPPVSEADQVHQKLRADVRILDAVTAEKLNVKASTETTLVFNGALIMSPGNVFVLKGVAYKAVDVVRSHGQVAVTVEAPGSNEIYEAFDRRPLR